MNVNDIAITSLETITAFDIVTGAYLFTLDELQSASIAQTQDAQEITGKGGRRLNSLKRNKAVTISGSNGLVSGGLLEMQTGSSFEKKVTTVLWTDYLAVSGGAATTTYKAVGTAGAEIEDLYIHNADGSLGARLTQDANVAEGKFTYDPSTKALAFYTDIEDGTEVVVYYKRNISASVLENMSDIYSNKCTLYIDALGEDRCANVYRIQFYIPKADFSGEFTFEMGDDQTIHSFDAEALAGACGTAGQLWTYTVFGANEGDSDGVAALKSIAITTAPTKTSYSAGESFAPAGMVVKATYDDDNEVTLNAGSYTYAPNGALATTDTRIVVSYTEGGITRTASQAITVS